jgi:hypothetical protein
LVRNEAIATFEADAVAASARVAVDPCALVDIFDDFVVMMTRTRRSSPRTRRTMWVDEVGSLLGNLCARIDGTGRDLSLNDVELLFSSCTKI